MAYGDDENYSQRDSIPNGPDTSWVNTPRASGQWKDIASLYGNAASPHDVNGNGFFLSRPGSQYDPATGVVTIGDQLRDAGLANDGGFFSSGAFIKPLFGAALGAGLGGMLPGTTAFGAAGTGAGAAGMFSDLPAWAGGVATAGEGALGGGLAGAGLGAAGSAGASSALNSFGLDSIFDVGLPGFENNPFSFPGSAGTGGGPTTAQIPGFSDNMPSWASPTAAPASGAATSPFAAPTTAPTAASLDPKTLIEKYGFDAGKAILNYFQNQGLADEARKAGQSTSALNDPRRQPFINQATLNVTDPNAFLNNPRAQAILAQLNAQRQSDYGKHGYGGTDVSKWDTQTAAKMAELLNDEQKSLLPYTGFDQNNAQTSYLSQRDNLAFKTQSYQGFTALAAKIGGDKGAQSAISDAATALGKSIMSFFS